MPTPSIRLGIWLLRGCCAMGGLVHESIGFVFFVLSTSGMTSPAVPIAFRFAPRTPIAPAPNDLGPRPPRGITPADDGYWWYMKSPRPRPYTQQCTQENKHFAQAPWKLWLQLPCFTDSANSIHNSTNIPWFSRKTRPPYSRKSHHKGLVINVIQQRVLFNYLPMLGQKLWVVCCMAVRPGPWK